MTLTLVDIASFVSGLLIMFLIVHGRINAYKMKYAAANRIAEDYKEVANSYSSDHDRYIRITNALRGYSNNIDKLEKENKALKERLTKVNGEER